MDRVLVVLVLYRRSFAEVPSHHRLLDWLERPALDGWHTPLLLIYDNSPQAQTDHSGWSTDRIQLVHDADNGGTRAAYLAALALAEQQGCGWILFLDHDTDLPETFLRQAKETALAAEQRDGVLPCAVVPHVADRAQTISPAVLKRNGLVRPDRNAAHLCGPGECLTAIASASLVRTAALAEIQPIPEEFRLDYLDHWIFRELQERGGRVAVSASEVDHALSVTQMGEMSVMRYTSILRAESHFLRESPSGFSRVRYTAWLLFRALRMLLRERRPDLARLCLNAAMHAAPMR